MQTIRVKNPILRGLSPDPNILRAKDRYYIIISSFEWPPGIRVYESKNLVSWPYTTDISTTQVSLQGNSTNGSIWAPQISYTNGLFYLVCTDVKSAGRPFKDVHNYLITASEITGPWSEPIYLNSNGFDPSLLHDLEAEKKQFVNELQDYRLDTLNKFSGIVLQEYDTEEKKLDGPIYKIFAGTELTKTGASHLYFRNGYYYLMTAEGGTGRGHSVTVCRAKNIIGPYELDPGFPMLTASDKPASTLQCTGHGSLVQAPSEKWYMTYLYARPLNGAVILGREAATQEAYWTSDDWLKLRDSQTVPMEEITTETSEGVQQEREYQFMDTFGGKLKKNWNARRILPGADWCDTKTRPGFLRLIAGESLQSTFDHHLLAIRQTDFTFDAETTFEYTPDNFNQMAGLILYLNESNYIYCYVTWDENKGKCLRMIESENGVAQIEEWRIPLTEKKTSLKVAVKKEIAQFCLRDTPSKEWKEVGLQKNACIPSGGFTGNSIGIAIHDLNRKRGSYADFEFFKYDGEDHE